MRITIFGIIWLSLIFGASPGESGFPLLRVNFYPRAIGLGETYTAMSEDAGSMWWNPGSSGWLEHSEAFVTYHQWFMGFMDIYGGLTYATRMGLFGFGLIYSGTSGIEGWDENNEETEQFGQTSGILNFSYARKLNPRFATGFNFKGLYDKIGDETGSGFGIDLGGNYLISEIFRAGAVIKDFGTSMKYSSTSSPLPTSFRVGLVSKPRRDLNLLTDLEYTRLARPTFHLGGEYWIREIVALRAGFKTKPNEGKMSYYTAGLGFKIQKFYFDYAFVPYSSELGMTHRFLVGTRFGELTPRGNLQIRIIDASEIKPLIADVTIIGPTMIKGSSDSINGIYLLRNQPPGLVRIKVQKNKYYPKEDTATIEKDITKTKLITLNKIPPGEIIGLITDVKTKRVLGARVKYEGIMKGEVRVDSMVGLYRISNLEAGKYVLKVEPLKPKYYSQSCTLAVEPGKTVVRDFELIKEKEVIILKGVNFETAKATLLPESYPILDYAGKILVENPEIVVELAGHTDNRRIRTKEFPSNLELSQARANAVRDYLINKFKIDPDRLIARGYGETRPIATNKTEAGRAQNRRTEFKVLSGVE
ncbi:MAG: PorV/PorQ family protein [candidate division WOR-3 bacterium]